MPNINEVEEQIQAVVRNSWAAYWAGKPSGKSIKVKIAGKVNGANEMDSDITVSRGWLV